MPNVETMWGDLLKWKRLRTEQHHEVINGDMNKGNKLSKEMNTLGKTLEPELLIKALVKSLTSAQLYVLKEILSYDSYVVEELEVAIKNLAKKVIDD